jgi:hypothetical protein
METYTYVCVCVCVCVRKRGNKNSQQKKSRKVMRCNKLHYKVKVNLSLCLTKHHAMKTYWGGDIAPRIHDLSSKRR